MSVEIESAPTLRPSEQEFADFHAYVSGLERQYSQKYGVVKVVPPKSWQPRKGDYVKSLDTFLLQGPIEQNVYGKGGIYELLLIQKKSLPLAEYRKKVLCFNDITDQKSVEEVEDLFWKNISFSPPLYGADIKGSIMDPAIPWNLGELDSVLSKGLPRVISGVNVPYLYIGSWKTMFGWHKEDLDLSSINFLHHGKSKFWYSLPKCEGHKLEAFARECFTEGFSKCSEFLRHKTVMINPYLLKKNIEGLKIHKLQHNPGEFAITFGGAYHSGFNWGFNIAEAVNFATPYWLEAFLEAKPCKCIRDTVKIDKEEFLQNLLKTELKNLPELKAFERALKSIKPGSSTRSPSKSQSPSKALLAKTTKMIQKMAKIPAKKTAMISRKRGRKAKI